jgi:lysophospholipase L1-like esterase
MFKFLVSCCAVLLLALPARAACPASPVPAFALPATGAAIAEGRHVTILALGSSSTEGFGASSPAATYPARLESRLRAAFPARVIEVLNRGRGGENLPETLRRLGRDVLAVAPTLVIWQVGANDVLRHLDPTRFQAGLEAGLGALRAAGIEVLLMDNQEAPRMRAVPGEKQGFEELTARIAAAQGVPLFARGVLMRQWEQAGLPNAAVIGPDGLHHTDLGYDCIAAALADGIMAAVRPTLSSRSGPRP